MAAIENIKEENQLDPLPVEEVVPQPVQKPSKTQETKQRKKLAKQKEVIEFICKGLTDTQICKKVKATGNNNTKGKYLDQATLSLWKREPEFRGMLDEATQEAFLQEERLKTRIRCLSWLRLEQTLNGSQPGFKAIQMGFDITKPEKKQSTVDINVQFGPPLDLNIKPHLKDIAKDPTEESETDDE